MTTSRLTNQITAAVLHQADTAGVLHQAAAIRDRHHQEAVSAEVLPAVIDDK